jgi:hypothetical protein
LGGVASELAKLAEERARLEAASDVLGQLNGSLRELLGARRQDLAPEHVFGKPSAPKGGEPSAGEVRGTSCCRFDSVQLAG